MKPSLPHDPSSLSLWHRTTRSFPHLHANRLNPVPPATKYVIVGSGISGALTGWELIESGVKGDEIVILEAREAVSGASGRNAGHIRPGMSRAKLTLSTHQNLLSEINTDRLQTHFGGFPDTLLCMETSKPERSWRMRKPS